MGGNTDNKLTIRPPGAMHHARWMAKAIYSLKMCLLQSEFSLTDQEKDGLLALSLFIVTTYVKPWITCPSALKAPYQDLCFLKTLKQYENIDKEISKSAFAKFCQHLWYLSPECAIFSLFDNDVELETKAKMVANFSKENVSNNIKRYILDEGSTDFLLSKHMLLFLIVCLLLTLFVLQKNKCATL